ncbi:MAG TPA: hypothetical protein VHT74_04990 [Acetobacteraceae bacterium]|nr:hypothetical protein [Acetobacteraceae bacterium]
MAAPEARPDSAASRRSGGVAAAETATHSMTPGIGCCDASRTNRDRRSEGSCMALVLAVIGVLAVL